MDAKAGMQASKIARAEGTWGAVDGALLEAAQQQREGHLHQEVLVPVTALSC